MLSGALSNRTVRDAAVAAAGLAVAWAALYAAFGSANPFYVVSSGSMVPALEVNDIIVVDGRGPIEAVEVGDVIVFDRPSDGARVIVHRAVSITSEDPFTVRTRGDANAASIPGTDFPITEDEYIGKVAHVVPQVGYISKVLMPPVNYVIIAVIIGAMVAKHLSGRRAAARDPPGEGGPPPGA